MLFAISGFLFFHNLQPRWADYRRKFGGRAAHRRRAVPALERRSASRSTWSSRRCRSPSIYFSRDFLGEVEPRARSPTSSCCTRSPIRSGSCRRSSCASRSRRCCTGRRASSAGSRRLPFAVLWILGDTARPTGTTGRASRSSRSAPSIALERRRGVRARRRRPGSAGSSSRSGCSPACSSPRSCATSDAFWAHSAAQGCSCAWPSAAVWFGYEAYLSGALEGRRLTPAAPAVQLLHLRRPGAAADDDQARGPARARVGRRGRLVVYFGAAMLTLVIVCSSRGDAALPADAVRLAHRRTRRGRPARRK